MRNKTLQKRLIVVLCVCLVLLLGVGFILHNNLTTPSVNQTEDRVGGSLNTKQTLKAHYIDVGQGDSIFIELPNEETLLIDGGVSKSKQKIVKYIKSLNYNGIDYVIATHAHADHIGGMYYILDNLKIKNLYLSPTTSNTLTFKKMIEEATKTNVKIYRETVADDYIINLDYLKLKIYAPFDKTQYSNLNNSSVVCKLSYGESDFFFTGDAEKEIEKEILNKYNEEELDSEVLKVGHHGSDTSSDKLFVQSISPQIAVISCGKNNKYKHPRQVTLNLFKDFKVKIYRTDLQGTISIISDNKENFKVTTEKITLDSSLLLGY